MIVRRSIRPAFALAALMCLLAAYPVARLSAWLFSPPDDLLGYGGLMAGIAGLAGTLMLGLVLACIAFHRREQPRALPWGAAALNFGGILLLTYWLFG